MENFEKARVSIGDGTLPAAPDDDFAGGLKRQVLDAYGIEDEADLDFDGYMTASAEYEADREAFRVEMIGRMEQARQDATAVLRTLGALPAGFELAWEG
jgi:hypothetical protein